MFKTEIVTAEQASNELLHLRRRNNSLYADVADAIEENVDSDVVLKLILSKKDVLGLRIYLKRYYGKKYIIRSSKIEGTDDYAAFVFAAK